MPTTISTSSLDHILALQITVAWAGEQHGDAAGLAWWNTSLSDPDGGGDFLHRMFPRTHVWAALGGMREAARRADEKARANTARPDELITLFHFGFAWDEALQERFEHHKRQSVEPASRKPDEEASRAQRDPATVFDKNYAVLAKFDRAAFETYLGALAGKVAVEIVPGGRQLSGPVSSPEAAATQLARALLPLTAEYPLPFYSSSALPEQR